MLLIKFVALEAYSFLPVYECAESQSGGQSQQRSQQSTKLINGAEIGMLTQPIEVMDTSKGQ